MKISGSAIMEDASSTYVIDYKDQEVSKNELLLLAYANLTWEGLEEKSNWAIDGKVFNTMDSFQMRLRKIIRFEEYYFPQKMTFIDNMEIILLNGATEMMDIYSIKESLKVKAIGENHTIVAEVPAITDESIKKLEEYKGYPTGYCSDWTGDELKVYFFAAGMSTTLYQVKN